MTTKKLKVADGKIVIWDDASDDAPFVNSLANAETLARTKFDSSRNYIAVIEEITGTLNLPARSSFTDVSATYPLAAHGQAGPPFIFAQITLDGEEIAVNGSIPVQMGNTLVNTFGGITVARNCWFGRWITIGVDGTHIYASEYAVANYLNASAGDYNGSYPAASIPLKLYITDLLL